MKRLLFILCLVAMVCGCDKENERRDVLDHNALLNIYPAQGVKSSNSLHLSALEIVTQATGMTWENDTEGAGKAIGFSDGHRDLATPKFIYPADYVINPADTTIEPTFLYAYDLTFAREIKTNVWDTVAYIPNSIMREAERLVTAAFNKQDYLTCYEVFDSLYIFQPITGAEWKALKAQGKN